MIKIKNIQRIALAVKDLEGAVKDYQRMFGIKPFNYGIAKEEKYHWIAFELGEGQCTMEFLSPWNDPNGEVLIGKYIREHGEGLYMVTLRTAGDADKTVDSMRELGIEPSWGSVAWNDTYMSAGGEMAAKWQEHYISPKYTHGALFTLATIERKEFEKTPLCADDYKLPVAGKKK